MKSVEFDNAVVDAVLFAKGEYYVITGRPPTVCWVSTAMSDEIDRLSVRGVLVPASGGRAAVPRRAWGMDIIVVGDQQEPVRVGHRRES